MALADRWLLPEGVKELLPPQARRVESLRRRIIDLYESWGYEQVMPPLMEHLDSLLTGVGRDLEMNTFKVTDQLSGHMLGVRADITPQVARIDAHVLRSEGPSRLCYCASVLHARTAEPLASRNPLQLGAELYGHAGLESDLEVIVLMLTTLRSAGVARELTLDLGHVDIFRGLMQQAGIGAEAEAEYMDILARKALPELDKFLVALNADARQLEILSRLPRLNGDRTVLDKARELFSDASAEVLEAIDYLALLADSVARRFPEVDLYFDLSELRGYAYHTGVVFAAFTPGRGQAIAKGGRYDAIGEDFGRARPATGFSADLKTLIDLSDEELESGKLIEAPAGDDQSLLQQIEELRAQGLRVVQKLPGSQAAAGCTAELVQRDGAWVVVDL
ncbi:ATP phosphoribosyltransferase regulatory subunit [Marinobacterium jannaschii]|uniref:ATP phosphoribosyltransferase regulatory subunit n=1 Tax=Marinobacterium jannaschii TaxID=64970 RepID=UPI00047F4F6C|nr:ATP phosphoribosyltransferase regulatory subunit [Marinobacterium jannaschii]